MAGRAGDVHWWEGTDRYDTAPCAGRPEGRTHDGAGEFAGPIVRSWSGRYFVRTTSSRSPAAAVALFGSLLTVSVAVPLAGTAKRKCVDDPAFNVPE